MEHFNILGQLLSLFSLSDLFVRIKFIPSFLSASLKSGLSFLSFICSDNFSKVKLYPFYKLSFLFLFFDIDFDFLIVEFF